MQIATLKTPPVDALSQTQAPANLGKQGGDNGKLRESFDSFVGQTFYGQMLSAMHKTVGKPAYFNGGRAEEVFQGQLDQVLSEHLTKASGSSFTGPMFDLFNLQRGA